MGGGWGVVDLGDARRRQVKVGNARSMSMRMLGRARQVANDAQASIDEAKWRQVKRCRPRRSCSSLDEAVLGARR